jgi:predicted MFS family arabinose efflux permease
MTCPTSALPARPPARTFEITPRGAFYLLASITMTFLAGSSAPTPLYPIYQQLWHFSPVTVTVIFAAYAIALLAMLLVTGRLSDHVGRRPVLMAATVAQALTMVVFAIAQGVPALIAARILQGLATGAAIGAVGAGMLDIDKDKGTVANAVAPAMGTAIGGLFAGAMVRYLPAPTHLVYLVLAAVYLLQGLGVALMPEPGTRRPGALASLKVQLRAPRGTHGALVAAAPLLIAGWAIVGFYLSLGPALIHRVFGLDASLVGGVVPFLMAGSAGLAVLLRHRSHERQMRLHGASALVVGMIASLAALALHATSAFFAASIIAGAGFGLGFQGAVRSVVQAAAAAERAAVLSIVFIVSYLALGLPAVAAGIVVARTGYLVETALTLGALVAVLAAIALHLARRRRDPAQRMG